MASEIVALVGPARAGKTSRLLDAYADALRATEFPVGGQVARRLARTIWLAPNGRVAASVREALLGRGLSACLNPGVTTFARLAEQILVHASRPVRMVTPVVQRQLIRQLVESARQAGDLNHFERVAEQAGFADLVSETIAELKRRGVAPNLVKQLPHNPAKHAEIGDLYAAYQSLLGRHGMEDAEGLLLAAAHHLNELAEPQQDVALLVLDGFREFTGSQLALLRALVACCAATRITLVSESDDLVPGEREELFARTKATLQRLRRQHPELRVEQVPQRASTWPALDYISRNLFRNPHLLQDPLPTELATLSRMEVVAASSAQNEITEIAGRIKQLLASGEARPGDIAVVFRTLHDAAPRVREVFQEFGIPYVLDAGPPLIAAPTLKTLVDLLRLREEDWPFRRLKALITNRLIGRFDGAGRAEAEWLVRALQLPVGRQRLMNRLEQLAEQSLPDPTPTSGQNDASGESGQVSTRSRDGHARRCRAARVTFELLAVLANALDELPDRATPREWALHLERLADTLQLQLTSHQPRDGIEFGAAWPRVRSHLAEVAILDHWLERNAAGLTAGELIRQIIDVSMHEHLPFVHDTVGRVRVLAAPAARTIEVQHLFMAGLSEQAFPLPQRSGRLCNAADYNFLENVGDQESYTDHGWAVEPIRDEMLLFYDLLTRASETVTFSYPALDNKAIKLLPSPFLTEVTQLVETRGQLRRSHPQLGAVPVDSSVFSPAQLRLRAVHEALAEQPRLQLLAALLATPDESAVGKAICVGMEVVHNRSRGDTFGPWEGVMAGAAARAQLSRRFGSKHHWSPSQLERYAACPYQFFQRDVLGCDPVGELVLQTDYRRRGTLLHDTLAEFHRTWQDEPPSPPEEFLTVLMEVLAKRAEAARRFGLDGALVEIERRQIAEWFTDYGAQHAAYRRLCAVWDGPPIQSHYELRFGPRRHGEAGTDEDHASTNDALQISAGDEEIRVTGRIDRIDVGKLDGTTVYNVVDFKSGSPARVKPVTAQGVQDGDLQVALYVLAAEMVLEAEAALPYLAGYWAIQKGGFRGRESDVLTTVDTAGAVHRSDLWAEIRQTLEGKLLEICHGARQGEFPMHNSDEQCTSHCDFSTVCRVAQARNLGKEWPAPTVETQQVDEQPVPSHAD